MLPTMSVAGALAVFRITVALFGSRRDVPSAPIRLVSAGYTGVGLLPRLVGAGLITDPLPQAPHPSSGIRVNAAERGT
jgi:hypothetical protein